MRLARPGPPWLALAALLALTACRATQTTASSTSGSQQPPADPDPAPATTTADAGRGATPAPRPIEVPRPEPRPEWMRIHIVDVGQGDCTIIETPKDAGGDRKVLMVDLGETSKEGNEARDTVEPYLRKRLDDGPPTRPTLDIDYFIGTHYHKDHMGWPKDGKDSGVFYLWDAMNIRIGTLLDTGLDYDAAGNLDGVYAAWVEEKQVAREKLRYDQLGPDRQLDLGDDVWVEVLSVAAGVDGMEGRVIKRRWEASTSQNDFSIAIIVHFKKFDFFVAGDQSGYFHKSWGNFYHDIESAMHDSLRDIEVLRVSHHGSQWSTNTPLLQRLRPEVAMISCGKGHHHPNEYTVRRILGWENFWTGWPTGSEIFQTELVDGYRFEGPHPHTGRSQHVANGHIVIETDGETGYTIWYEGLDAPIEFELDRWDAYTDVPEKIQRRRLGQVDEYPDVIEADEIDVVDLIEIDDEPPGD